MWAVGPGAPARSRIALEGSDGPRRSDAGGLCWRAGDLTHIPGMTHVPSTIFPATRAAGLAHLTAAAAGLGRRYAETRNTDAGPDADPTTSALSPYLHYGHISSQTIALAVQAAAAKNKALTSAKDSYFNELIAWRELSVNFVKYNGVVVR